MDKKKEFKKLIFMGKKILQKKILNKIIKEKDVKEKIQLLKHSIKVKLDLDYKTLRNKVDRLHKEGKDCFILFVKLNILFLKLKYFEIDYEKKEFLKIIKNFKSLEKEIKEI